jgi:hypothetical protein
MRLFLLRRFDGRSHTEPIKTLAFNVVDVVAQKQHFAAFTSLCTYEFGFSTKQLPTITELHSFS